MIDRARLAIVVGARRLLTARRGKLEALTSTIEATLRFAPATIGRGAWTEAVGEIAADGAPIERAELARKLGARSIASWSSFADRLMPAHALGLTAGEIPDDGPGWVAAITGRALGLWTGGKPPTPGGLGDALAWRELGLPGKPKRCPAAVRAVFVERRLGIAAGGDFDRAVRLFAARELRAPRPDLRLLRDALVRGWLVDDAPAPDDTAAFVAAVAEVARRGDVACFGDRKLYIAAVHDALRRSPAYAALALDDFKDRLLAAHHRGAIALARADLVAAMDPGLVAASETLADGARFHFIVKDLA